MLLRIRARNASRWISYPNMRPCLTFGSPSGLENACVVTLVVGAHNPGPVALIRPSATFSRSAGEAVIRPRLNCGRLLGLRFQVLGQDCMCGGLFQSLKHNFKARQRWLLFRIRARSVSEWISCGFSFFGPKPLTNSQGSRITCIQVGLTEVTRSLLFLQAPTCCNTW